MMTYKVSRHILSGDDVEYLATARKDSGLFEDGLPDTLVIHYTAGSSLEGAVSRLEDPNIKASNHLVLGRDGRIKQLIPFNKIAWHAGKSEWGGRTGMNKYSIGIEIDNAGRLTKVEEFYKTWYGGVIPPKDVYYGTHQNETTPSYWHAFTDKQLEAVFEVCRVLQSKYDIKTIVGHEEISPGRKIDPGPAFPLDKLRSRVLEDRSSEEPPDEKPADENPTTTGVVTASRLNFRSDPNLKSELVSDPLPQGTKVIVLKEQDGWIKVNVPLIGWVKKEYVKIEKESF